MIFDAEDLAKVLGKVMERALPKALHDHAMRMNHKDVRFVSPTDDLLEMVKKDPADGGLNKEEREFYGPEIDRAYNRFMAANRPDTFHKMPEIPSSIDGKPIVWEDEKPKK